MLCPRALRYARIASFVFWSTLNEDGVLLVVGAHGVHLICFTTPDSRLSCALVRFSFMLDGVFGSFNFSLFWADRGLNWPYFVEPPRSFEVHGLL